MSDIKRWEFVGGDGPCAYPQEEPDGRMVAYVDHIADLAALREALATLRDQHAEQSCIFCNDSGELLSEVKRLRQSLTAAEQRNAELEKDAARYTWLRDKSESVHQFYLSTPIWFTGVKFSKENVDITIDAALKPTESGASE